MKVAHTLKTLSLVGVTALGLQAGVSQADFGYRGYQNPYLPAPQSQVHMDFRQQMDQFDVRLDNQLQRILNGMERGRLTMQEAVQLLREHQAINALEREYLADGHLGLRELRELDQRLDEAARHIHYEAHDHERTGFDGRWEGWRR